jgi:ATP-binding cassette subfamily C (CFTR/MRP) protein 1
MYQPLLPDEAAADDEHGVSLEDNNGIYSMWTYSYLNPLFKLGAEKDLTIDDLGSASKQDRCNTVYSRFASHWEHELTKPEHKRSLWNALWHTAGYGTAVYAIGLFALYAALSFVPVLILSILVGYFEDDIELSEFQLWGLVAAMFIVPMFASLLQSQSNAVILRMATHIRNALVDAIFRKALLLSPDSRQQQSTGKIINMFANDTKQIQFFLYVINNMVVAPFQIAIILYLIFLQVGVSAFVGLGYMIIISPFNGIMLNAINQTRKKKMIDTDSRVKLMNEVLNGIRVIKYYGWELAFKDKIEIIRRMEAKNLRKIAYISAVGFALLFFSTPIILPIVIFYAYIMMGNNLTAATAFTTIALFNMLLMPFAFLPYGIVQYLQSKVSVKRITGFLCSNELQKYINESEGNGMNPIYSTGDNDLAVKITNANMRWQLEEAPVDPALADAGVVPRGSTASQASQRELESQRGTAIPDDSTANTSTNSRPSGYSDVMGAVDTSNRAMHTLMNINVEIEKGSLVAIVGAVGSGKSSLLNTILGEMYMEEGGSVSVRGSIAYCDQRPWILNATIEDNILFGSAKVNEKFDSAIEIACLTDDLKIMPDGLQTEIGERGINLSGGQKARVSLARALYLDADIYVLDDPLAAVDAHVGQQIFEGCVRGALKEKTRILVTHQLHLLEKCDRVIILENGFVKASGSYKDLARSGIDITAFIPSSSKIEASPEAPMGSPIRPPGKLKRNISASSAASSVDVDLPGDVRERLASKDSVHSAAVERALSCDGVTAARDENVDDSDNNGNPEKPTAAKSGAGLITTEELATGNVDFGVYSAYIKAGGVGLASVVVMLLTGVQAFSLGSSFYLTYWASESANREDNGEPMSNKTNLQFMLVFFMLSVGKHRICAVNKIYTMYSCDILIN